MSELDRELLRRRALGWSPACEPIEPGAELGRDLRLAHGESGLDLARVEAVDCLAQSLSLALTTMRGSDVFDVEFGFDGLNALAEETIAAVARERVRVGVIDVLHRDPRVRRIADVKLAGEKGGEERPPAGAQPPSALQARVAFEAVSGDSVTVDLGEVPDEG